MKDALNRDKTRMNWHVVIGIPLGIICLVFIVIFIHDQSTIIDKTNKLVESVRANETCSELKSDLAFTDQENQGLWLKSPYDPDVLKYYKEKQC